MRRTGTKTKYLGVYRIKDRVFRVRAKRVDPRMDKTIRQKERLVVGVSLQEAIRIQRQLSEELEREGRRPARERVSLIRFAKSWIESRAAVVSPSTADRYVDALENHVLRQPTGVGRYFVDALRREDVQRWVNTEVARGYSVATVKGWFRVLRSMFHDAMADFDLRDDPTARIRFPDEPYHREPNSLTPDQLRRFLAAMQGHHLYGRNYALSVVLAFTGLRFSHASALKWGDIDFKVGVLRIARRQVRGQVGPVSRRKRAPNEIPMHPQILEILRAHRGWLIRTKNPGLLDDWVFPSLRGTLKTPGTLKRTWSACLRAIGFSGRFSVHGLRRTFNDLCRHAGYDGIVTRSLTGHVTEAMTAHYSTVGLEERRAAVGKVLELVQGARGADGRADAPITSSRPGGPEPSVTDGEKVVGVAGIEPAASTV